MTTSRPLAPRVLVVEDEPFIAFLVADQLAELGYARTRQDSDP
jgi:CheY-like chemotaxis protein